MRTLSKLILNSMYGFFGKKDYKKEIIIASAEWNAV